jgi:hypothetical protein
MKRRAVSAASRRRKAALAGVALFVWGPVAVHAQDGDFQSWSNVSVRWWRGERGYLGTTGTVRFVEDASQLGLWRLGQVGRVRPRPWLETGVAWRYTRQRSAAGDFEGQHRLELEATPSVRLPGTIGAAFRNRVELRWNGGGRGTAHRTRHRAQVRVATPGWGPIRAVDVRNELFYDLAGGRLAENRFAPLGVTMRFTDGVSLRGGYMVRSIRGTPQWSHLHVVTTGLSILP